MLCIAENNGGFGGISGGGGASGQGSQSATGVGVSSYGYPVIEVVTGMTTTIQVQLTKDYNGEVPSNLEGITKVVFMARPSMNSTCNKKIEKECSFSPDGVVTLELTPEELNYNNGVWYAEFLCYKDDLLVQNYRSYLCIRKGMTGSSNEPNTITVMDIRMALMDTSAEANQLIDDLEFSDMMILHAIERCIDEWNETPPELSRQYTAVDFPYRESLIKGAVGFLMQSIAYRYTRNRMMYAASGFQLDTNDKGPQYIQLAALAREEWKRFIASKKTEHNMYECFGSFDLPYFGNRSSW